MSYTSLQGLGTYETLDDSNLGYIAPHQFVLDKSILVTTSSHPNGARCNRQGCPRCHPICETCSKSQSEHNSDRSFQTNLNKSEKSVNDGYLHLPSKDQEAIQQPVIPFKFSQDAGNVKLPEVQSLQRRDFDDQRDHSDRPMPPQRGAQRVNPPSRGVSPPRQIPQHQHKVDKNNSCGISEKAFKAGISCNLTGCSTCRPVCMICKISLKRM